MSGRFRQIRRIAPGARPKRSLSATVFGSGLCHFQQTRVESAFRRRTRLAPFIDQNMSAIPLTVRGAELLKEELQRLKSVERPSVINAISEARAQGDLSENADYDAAKERQSFIEGRIQDLEGKLSNAQVIDPSTLDAEGRIVFGTTVELEDLDSSAKVTYQIVGDDEADIKVGKISISSPIARALINKVEGDVAQVQAPAGIREYEVLAVRYI
jgi:transcription elongation factor GreA